MDKTQIHADRFQVHDYDDRTALNIGEQFNDTEKVKEFKKRFEEFIIDEEEDLIGEMSQIIPDSRPYNKELYASILLNARSSRTLCNKFEAEPCGLQKSDAKGNDMSFGEIFKRMQTGHKVYKYNYNTASRKIVNIKINNGTVEISTSENRKSRIGFSDVYGITLGACSSTFKMYKKQIDYKVGKLHEHEDCFSIINEFRSYDFASTSSLAKYDICISLSWLCSLNNSLQSTIPFTKCKNYSDFLSYKNIMDKLKKEAQIRLISLYELFLVFFKQLGIYKTLKQLENQNGMNSIIVILNKRFTFSGKLYRFIRFIVMPLIASDSYIRKDLKDMIRINLLLNNKLKFLSNILERKDRNKDKLEAKTKRTVLESMIVSSCKSIFKSSESSDPFLAALRQRAKK